MQVSKLIEKLEILEQSVGDVDVTITDGWEARCYQGWFHIAPFLNEFGKMTIDIGIGGTEQ